MKKFLLATSALIGAVAFSGAALAQGPKVTVGGVVDFQASWADQKNVFQYDRGSLTYTAGTQLVTITGTTKNNFSREFRFQNEKSYIDVKVEGKADNGLGYGAAIRLQANLTADKDNGGADARYSYMFLESNAGRVEMGGNTDAAQALKVDPSSFARATGGIEGNMDDYINFNGLRANSVIGRNPTSAAVNGNFSLITQSFISNPRLPTALQKGVGEYANRITYYSPRWSGVQVGVSYAPDLGERGNAVGFNADNAGDYENVFNAGINYTGQYDQVGIAAAVTGETGKNELSTIEKLRGWNAGVNLSYMGFSFGGSYGDLGKTFQLKTSEGKRRTYYWTAGAAYETGPYGVSLTFLNGKYRKSRSDIYSLGADYQLAPGLLPYVEVNHVRLKEESVANKNNATNVIVGSRLSF